MSRCLDSSRFIAQSQRSNKIWSLLSITANNSPSDTKLPVLLEQTNQCFDFNSNFTPHVAPALESLGLVYVWETLHRSHLHRYKCKPNRCACSLMSRIHHGCKIFQCIQFQNAENSAPNVYVRNTFHGSDKMLL